MSDDEIIREAREAFELAADAEAENRREALDDLKFARLGEQWPAQIRRERDHDGRPCLTINRLGPRLLRFAATPAGAHAPPRRLWSGAAGMSPRLILVLAAAAILLAAGGGLYWKGRHDDAVRERPKTEAALAQAAVAGLETQGAQASAQRVEVVVRQREAANAVVAQLMPKALKSEDANAPLDPARAARLRDADIQLCLSAPGVAGCAASGDASGGRP